MPASSYSSSVSWALYLAASFLLLGTLFPVLNGAREYSDAKAATATADGLSEEINSLRPGVTAVARFDSPGSALSVELHGHSLLVLTSNFVVQKQCEWLLPNMTLAPDTSYDLQLLGTRLEVFQVV